MYVNEHELIMNSILKNELGLINAVKNITIANRIKPYCKALPFFKVLQLNTTILSCLAVQINLCKTTLSCLDKHIFLEC